MKLSDTVERKFIDSVSLQNWEIDTPDGWKPLTAIHKTIPYRMWRLETENGFFLEGADTHIVILNDRNRMLY